MFAIMQIILTKKRYLSLDIFLIIDTFVLKIFDSKYVSRRQITFIVQGQPDLRLPYLRIVLTRQ